MRYGIWFGKVFSILSNIEKTFQTSTSNGKKANRQIVKRVSVKYHNICYCLLQIANCLFANCLFKHDILRN